LKIRLIPFHRRLIGDIAVVEREFFRSAEINAGSL
jgi:hypothetical protein